MKTRLIVSVAFLALCAFVHAQTDVKAEVSPLLTTAWGQDAPYNMLCPEKANAEGELRHCRVGCVACAMGQVMRYYRYPEVGIGTGQNLFNPSLTVNFGETHYDWGNMLDNYHTGFTDEEVDAVATLLYHCGVAVNMIYGLESSSTFTAFANNMVTALSRCFGYDTATLRSVNRSKYSKEEWLQLIREELSAGRPIIYSGNSASMGGHTWVVDGYDAEGRIHMNWGWQGVSNDYYDIDLNVAGLDFSQKQSMVIGIQPPAATTIQQVGEGHGRSEAWYNLNGQRVASPARGLYIHNGRKIIRNH